MAGRPFARLCDHSCLALDAEVIAFLASPGNRATRGAVLPDYGGW